MSTFAATFPATGISGAYIYATPISPSSSRSSSPLSSSSSSSLSSSYTNEYPVDILYGPRLRIIALPALSDEEVSPVKDVNNLPSSFAVDRRRGQRRSRRDHSTPPSPKSPKSTISSPIEEFVSSYKHAENDDMAAYHGFSSYTPSIPPAHMCYAPITLCKPLPRCMKI